MGPGRPASECENEELVSEFELACRGGDYEFAPRYRAEIVRRLEANNPIDIDKRWQDAIENARFYAKVYSEIPTGIYALSITIRPAIERYERGERTDDLLELLESIE